jgi:hypothetical protein
LLTKPQVEEVPEEAPDVDRLKEAGDVAGLLALAKAYRSGTLASGRDMKRCLEVYRTAADLGSAEADYAVALFCLSGSVVSQDLKEGATRLRSAAEKGSIPAKVYLGNLYELGIHYKADPEKADVWYRNAARGAHVESEAGTPEYARELAELGCARYVLAEIEKADASEDDKTRLMQRARAHGYGLRIRDDAALDRPTLLDALQGADKPESVRPPVTATIEAKDKPAAKTKSKPAGPSAFVVGIGAFGYAVLFAIAGVGAGYAATLGARELVAHGHVLPGLGTKADLVFPIVLALVGVLPTWLVYRFGTVLKALLAGAFVGGIGWIAWGMGQAAFPGRGLQAISFALAGFLGGLFLLGMFGGTKRVEKGLKNSKYLAL